jgi:hypothetical protein
MGESLDRFERRTVQAFEFKKLLIRSWWTVAFCVLCSAFYFQSAHNHSSTLADLSSRYRDMEKEKRIAAQERDELNVRLQSESDPAWIEMILMKELGVVPEGWTKVHFKK